MLKHYLSKLTACLVLVFLTSVALQAQPNATVVVNTPANVAGNYDALQAVFGPGITMDITADVVEAVDTAGLTTVCDSIATDLTGAIALVDRGACSFVQKVTNAEAKGAIAVIVCNSNEAVPTQAIVMGGDDMGTINIPSVMIPYAQCQTIRAELGNGLNVTLTTTVDPPLDGELCETAIVIGAGTHTVDTVASGYGALFASASNAVYYSYTPAADGLITVRSCGLSATDTRLVIMTGPDCDPANLTVVTSNDDCDPDNNNFASEVQFLATGGTSYLVYWDDPWSNSGFDFEIIEEALPAVNATLTVDMSNEMVSADGVNLFWSTAQGGGLNVTPMSDNGDGTYSATINLTALDSLGYIFLNGAADIANAESVPADCGFDNPVLPVLVRGLVATSATDFSVPAVCFGLCTVCPDLDCAEAPVVSENLDGYTEGAVGPQSDVWTTWSGTEGGAEDGLVSSEQAFSAPNSVKIEGQNGPVDVLVLLGNQTEGKWLLTWKMYIPAGSYGYYNIQEDETPAVQWIVETQFNNDGTGQFNSGQAETFTFPHDAWFDVTHVIDLDNDVMNLSIAGLSVLSNEIYGDGNPDNKLGSIDLFPTNAGPHLYYVDDLVLRPLTPCEDGSLICDSFEGYAMGPVSDQSDYWAPWTSSPADDGVVTMDNSSDGCQSLLITDGDPDDQILRLGDHTEGRYTVSWQMYVEPGFDGYYNFQKFQDNPGGEFGMQVVMTGGTGTLDATAAAVTTFAYPEGEWFEVSHEVDLDNDWMTMTVAGTDVFGWPASATTFGVGGTLQLGGVDFFGNTNNLYYIDEVKLIQLASIPGNICDAANDINELFGQAQDEPQTSGIWDNSEYTTSDSDPSEGWECFGEPDGGGSAPSLERTIWYTFEGDGETYFIQTVPCDAENYIGDGDTQIAIYSGSGCGDLTPVACNEDGADAPNFEAQVELVTEPGVTYYMLIDGFGPDFEQMGEYCVEVTKLTQAVVSVTFQVDMSLTPASAEGVFLAGSFNGWPNPGEPMTEGADNVWSVTLAIAANTTHEYKFQNGTGGWEDIPGEDCTTGGFGNNRFVDVAGADITLDPICFNTCVLCVDATTDQILADGISVFPNPASDVLNVNFDLSEATDALNVRLINTLGQTVYSNVLGRIQTENLNINVSNLAAGAYMLHVSDGKAQYSSTIVIE